MAHIYLIAAIFFLLATIGLFLWDWLDPATAWRVRGLNISAGWLGLLLALYNLARWRRSRSYAQERQAKAEQERRRRQRRTDEEGPSTEYHPEFRLDDAPRPSDQLPE